VDDFELSAFDSSSFSCLLCHLLQPSDPVSDQVDFMFRGLDALVDFFWKREPPTARRRSGPP